MPHCPRCLTEYVEGVATCEECGASLAPGEPPQPPPRPALVHEPDVKLVPARTYQGGTAQMDAEVARGVLESQGIPAALSGEGAGEPFPLTRVILLVREEDEQKALRVLAEYFDKETPAG